MSFDVNLKPEQERALREIAAVRGISVDDLVDEIMRRNLGLPPITYPSLTETREDEAWQDEGLGQR